MELPFYYSFIEFKKDFNKNFTEWLTHYPNGDIDIFKVEYLKEYKIFYEIEDFTDKVIFEIKGCYHELNGDINNIYGLIRALNKHSGFFLDKSLKSDDKKNIKERKERINCIKNVPLNSNLANGYYLDIEMFHKIYPLLTFNRWGYIQVRDINYKDFQYSVIKIVDFLINGEKQTEIQQPQTQPTPQIQADPTINEDDFSFINNFDSVEPKTVYEHFFNSLVKDKNYIDEDTLKNFLITVFQNRQSLNKKITLNNNPTKKGVTAIFYNYYNNIAGKPHGKQSDYVKLLSDNFTGFKEKTLMTNFSKSTY